MGERWEDWFKNADCMICEDPKAGIMRRTVGYAFLRGVKSVGTGGPA